MDASLYISMCYLFLNLFLNINCRFVYRAPSENDEIVNKLTTCVKKLVKSNIPVNSTIAFHGAPEDNQLNKNILNDLIRDSMNQEGDRVLYTFTNGCVARKPEYYIVAVSNIEEFIRFIDEEKMCADWRPTAFYLLLVTSMEATQTNDFFHFAWRYNIYKIAVMISDAANKNIEIFNWDMTCKTNYNNAELSKNMTIRNCTGSEKVFLGGMPEYFDGCQLRIAVNNFPPYATTVSANQLSANRDTTRRNFFLIENFNGVEIELLKYLCEKLKLTPQLVSASASGFPTALDMVLDGQIDALIGNVRIKYYRFNDFTFTYPHHYDDIHAITTNQYHRSLAEEIMSIFTFNVLIVYISILIASFSLYALFVLIGKRVCDRRERFGEGLLSAFAITIGLPAMLPRGLKGVLSLIVVQWFWMSFYARTVYQSALINILSDEMASSGADTLQALCERNYTIIVPDITEVRSLYLNKSYSDSGCHFTRDHFVECVDAQDCLQYVLRMPNIASFLSVNFFRSQKWKALRDEEAFGTEFYIINEAVFATPLSFQFKRGHPLADRFSALAFRFIEAGFLQYNFRQIKEQEIAMKTKNEKNNTVLHVQNAFHETKFRQLSMHQMLPIFQMFLGGSILSFVVYLAEIIIYYFTTLGKI